MASSVSVDDNIRKKIKIIAAELDTTQGEVVALGIELLENTIGKTQTLPEHPAREIMRNAIEADNSLDWRKEIRIKLQSPGISIDEVLISSWSEVDED